MDSRCVAPDVDDTGCRVPAKEVDTLPPATSPTHIPGRTVQSGCLRISSGAVHHHREVAATSAHHRAEVSRTLNCCCKPCNNDEPLNSC